MRRVPRSLWAIIAAVSVICLTVVAVSLLSGPRMTGFEVDTVGVVSTANQRLVLKTNQQLAEIDPSQISLSPSTPFTVTTNTDSIAISFTLPLEYNTEYTVTARQVTGSATDRASDFDVSFRTDEPDLYYLSRKGPDAGTSTKPLDRILRTRVGTPAASSVFAAPYIQEFVPIGSELAVVTVDPDGSNGLLRVDPDGRAVELTLPGTGTGTVHDLQAAPVQSLLGFRFTSAADDPGPHYENVLFVFDLATGVAHPLIAPGGEPMQVTNWGFMARRAEIVAQQYDSTLLLVDPLGVIPASDAGPDPANSADGTAYRTSAVPIPIGQFESLTAFAPDGLHIAVGDRDGQYVLDLSQGTQSAIVPQAIPGTTQYTAELHFLAGGDGFVQRLAEFDTNTGTVRQYLAVVKDGVSREIYRPLSDTEMIVGFSLSPNDQYLAVQIVPNRDTEVTDGYPVSPQATDATTLFLNIETGELRRSVLGFDSVWP